jgi:hypothetical protein
MATANLANLRHTSFLIEEQVPAFVRSDHPQFILFLEQYYNHLHSANTGVYDSVSNTYFMGPTHFTKTALEYLDVDTTDFDRFLSSFKAEFAPSLPIQLDSITDKASFYKNVLEFYKTKGTEESFKVLFRLLYGEEIELYYPNRDILTLSGGTFSPEVRIRLNTTDNIEDIVGRRIYGANSGVYATVERIDRVYDDIKFPWRDPADRNDSITFAYLNKFSVSNTTATQTEFDIGEKIYTGNVSGNHVNTTIHASPTKTVFFDDFSTYANVNFMLAPSDNRGALTDSVTRLTGNLSAQTAFSTSTGNYDGRWFDRWNIDNINTFPGGNNYVNPGITFITDEGASGNKVMVIGNEGNSHGITTLTDPNQNTEDLVKLVHNDNIAVDPTKTYRFTTRVKDPFHYYSDSSALYGATPFFNSGYSALKSDGITFNSPLGPYTGEYTILSSHYPPGAMTSNGIELGTGNVAPGTWTADWRVFQSYATGSSALFDSVGVGNSREYSNTLAFSQNVFSYIDSPAAFHTDTSYMRPFIQVAHNHNWVPIWWASFENPASDYLPTMRYDEDGVWSAPSHAVTLLTRYKADDPEDAQNSTGNLSIDTTHSLYGGASLRHRIPETIDYVSGIHLYNSLLAGNAVFGLPYHYDAEQIAQAGGIKVPKGKKWIFSYWTYTDSDHTDTTATHTGAFNEWSPFERLELSVMLLDSEDLTANSVELRDSWVGLGITQKNVWERHSAVIDLTSSDAIPSNYPSYGATSVHGTGLGAFTLLRSGPARATVTEGNQTQGHYNDYDTMFFAFRNQLSDTTTSWTTTPHTGNTVWYDGFQLEEVGPTTTTPSTFNPPGSGGSQVYLDYYKIEEMGTIEPLTNKPNYLNESSRLSTKSAVIQDNAYYQQYAYDIRSKQNFQDYTSVVEKAVHPAGFKRYGTRLSNSHSSGVAPTTKSSLTTGETFSPSSINSLAGWWKADAIELSNIYQHQRWSSNVTSNGVFGTNTNRLPVGMSSFEEEFDYTLTFFEDFIVSNVVYDSTAPIGENVLKLTDKHSSPSPDVWISANDNPLVANTTYNTDVFSIVLDHKKEWLFSAYVKTNNITVQDSQGFNTIRVALSLANTQGYNTTTSYAVTQNVSAVDTWERVSARIDASSYWNTRAILDIGFPDRSDFGLSTGNTIVHLDGLMLEEYDSAIHEASAPYTPSPYVRPGLNGADVVSWYDNSLNEHHVYANTHGIFHYPQYIANAINGMPAIRFRCDNANGTYFDSMVYPWSSINGGTKANGEPAFAGGEYSGGRSTGSAVLHTANSTAIFQATTMLANPALSRPVTNAWSIVAVAKTTMDLRITTVGGPENSGLGDVACQWPYRHLTGTGEQYTPTIINSGYFGYSSGSTGGITISQNADLLGTGGGEIRMAIAAGAGGDIADPRNPFSHTAGWGYSLITGIASESSTAGTSGYANAVNTQPNRFNSGGSSNVTAQIWGFTEFAGEGLNEPLSFHGNGKRVGAPDPLAWPSQVTDLKAHLIPTTVHDGITWSSQQSYVTSIGGWAPSNNQIFDTGTDGVNQKWTYGEHNWDGDIAEVLVFNEKLTNVQMSLVEGYLAHKYSIQENLMHKDGSISTPAPGGLDHPYRYDPPPAVGANNASDYVDY